MLHCLIEVIKEEVEYRSKRRVAKKQHTADKAQCELMHKVKQSEGYKNALLNRVTGTLPLADFLADSDEQLQSPKYGYSSQLVVTEAGYLSDIIGVCVPPDSISNVYLELITALDSTVNVVLVERSLSIGQYVQHLAYNKDLPVVRSVLLDYEELLVQEGNVGIIVYDNNAGEVHLTYHKDILVYAEDADPYKKILEGCGMKENEDLVYVQEVPHVHISSEKSHDVMEALKSQIGIDQSVVNRAE